MDIDIKHKVYSAIRTTAELTDVNVAEDTVLIGSGAILDSMQLVELCVKLEDLASDLGFEFDWTSDLAMSRSRSMFKTAGSLATEFMAQGNDKL